MVACLLALLVGSAIAIAVPAQPAAAAAQTVVSLTFDDGRATAYNARSILAAHGMVGTFYVISAALGTSSFYMTRQQVKDLAADGNEIGGHTAYHADLTQLDSVEQQREICYDRNTLLSMGLPVRSFAYPFGFYNAGAESAAAACGYNSARSTDVVTAPAVAESVPAVDPYAVRIGTGSLSLGALEGAVTAAVNGGGGWVPLMFHDVCSGCSSIAISAADLSALLDWLAGQAPNGVVVKTVGDVVGGPVRASVPGPGFPAAPAGVSTVHNASLEYAADGSAPDCFTQDGYGTNTAVWSRTTDAHSGGWAQRLQVSGYASGDAKLLIRQDLGACAPSVVAGHRYTLTTWYKSTAPTAFLVDKRGAGYTFGYWTTGPTLAAVGGWTRASWTTPVVPADGTGLSFGLVLTGNGTLSVDDVSITDADASGRGRGDGGAGGGVEHAGGGGDGGRDGGGDRDRVR